MASILWAPQVLLENSWVRVLRVQLQPGDVLPMHPQRAHEICALNSAKIKLSYPDGTSEVRAYAPGEAVFNPLPSHEAENVGTSDSQVVVVEVKSPRV
jgi:beta-alanine degradation protein BauB